ncbi:MAG: hypothetical protein HN509_03840 [Halobacteriovoraceae bacterium]|nr:hypothetical protein [Halobacteriovoraceae bacterium]MBT5093012.1 hypothetical protein [Halobacteriovoraceae bacterium]
MAQTELPKLPDFNVIKENLESERKAIIKVNGFADDSDLARSIEDATIVLDFVSQVQTTLHSFFTEFPSLISLFNQEYVSLHGLLSRDTVLELAFLDDCLMPEKEMFLFGQDGGLKPELFPVHLNSLTSWLTSKKELHVSAQERIRDDMNLDLKSKELPCQCVGCVADYRGQLREFVLQICLDKIEETKSQIQSEFETKEYPGSDSYYQLQKELDKTFYRVRFRLRRSTLNRLEGQVKGIVREEFTYPSTLASRQEDFLTPYVRRLLSEQDLNPDLLDREELVRFYKQMGTNIWRNERYLEREFKKLIKSMLILKRQDISGGILQQYLGEFWLHSQARTIKRRIIYHMGPTNSGKTYHSIQELCKAEKGCYLAPLRLLAAELYDTMNSKGVKTNLLTGEEVVEIEGATHYSSTIEMARFEEVFDCAVIDEIQMITDHQRGWAWTRALVNIFSPVVHVCGDPSAYDLVKTICDLCGDELEVKNYERMTELNIEEKPLVLGDLDRSDALIVFSRRNALKYKLDLERLDFKVSIVYGRLSPEVRREQARKFDQGETDIIVATDAIAMGMNLPIKRIVFSTLSKFINSKEFIITDSEIKQIAGRAGRYQRFPTGYVNTLKRVENGLSLVENALYAELAQKEKCMVGPDLEIFSQVNSALESNGLPRLHLSEFLRLFNTMTFKKPFFCVELKEMIEVAEMVEEADNDDNMTTAEIFGFACAPVNLGLMEHVQYFVWILNNYTHGRDIHSEPIDALSSNIDYLETSIKCVELYQWLSRHFSNKHFDFDENELLFNKGKAIEKLNDLLGDKIIPTCSSCGAKLAEKSQFAICEDCFKQRRSRYKRGPSKRGSGGGGKGGGGKKSGEGFKGKKKSSGNRSRKRKYSK